MDQAEFIRYVVPDLKHYAWFLGAGTSQSAGLPTAWDIIWDLKRLYYASQENQRIPASDMQNAALRAKIQSFVLSNGFPEEGASGEYTTYFELLFKENYDKQRSYLKKMLGDDRVSLSIGHRVLAALMQSGNARLAFTTNFDSVVEKASAEVTGKSISAFHIEGAYALNDAVNAEEYPIYCKLHGDFRYQSLKNLETDLASQNKELEKGFLNASNRFGLIVTGYSGRDASIMEMLQNALDTANPFPHGIFWTKLRASRHLQAVDDFIAVARSKGVKVAEIVEIETFDALMSRIWTQVPETSAQLGLKVRRATKSEVNIPLPVAGKNLPIIRAAAIPISSLPDKCLALKFENAIEWSELKEVEDDGNGKYFLTKGAEEVWAWGLVKDITAAFPSLNVALSTADMGSRLSDLANNLWLKGYLEKVISRALIQDKPLLLRSWRKKPMLIIDKNATDVGELASLHQAIGKVTGICPGLFTKPTDEHPTAEQVSWAESVQVSLEAKDGKFWLLLKPDVWIWPKRARDEASTFLDRRKADRYNKKFDEILSGWVSLLTADGEQSAEIKIQPFGEGTNVENPTFILAKRTAFSRKGGR